MGYVADNYVTGNKDQIDIVGVVAMSLFGLRLARSLSADMAALIHCCTKKVQEVGALLSALHASL